jgi:hypothetical protein
VIEDATVVVSEIGKAEIELVAGNIAESRL